MVIQKGLAALAILTAFTIAAEGVCSGQWTTVGNAVLYYTIKGTVLCDHCKLYRLQCMAIIYIVSILLNYGGSVHT